VSAVVAGSEEGYSGSDDEEVDGDDTSDDDASDDDGSEGYGDSDAGDFDAGGFGDADDTLTAGDGFAGGYVFSSRRPSESPR
jgi:hypothetical protein